MSFPNYEGYPGQQGQQDGGGAGPGAPPQQDPQIGGQAMGGEVPQFPAGNGALAPTGGQPQEGDQKTTLWYVLPKPMTSQTPRAIIGFLPYINET